MLNELAVDEEDEDKSYNLDRSQNYNLGAEDFYSSVRLHPRLKRALLSKRDPGSGFHGASSNNNVKDNSIRNFQTKLLSRERHQKIKP